jgi:hypothetical protein
MGSHVGEYQERKALGLCVRYSCKNDAAPDRVYCPDHAEKVRKYQGKQRQTRKHNTISKRWARNRIAAGECGTCGKNDLYSSTICEPCLIKKREVVASKYKRRREGRQRCSMCREIGHNAATCKYERYELPPIDQYATARNSNWVMERVR